MVNFLLQENIDDLQKLSDRLLHISDENGYIYADELFSKLFNYCILLYINHLIRQSNHSIQ